MSKKKKQKKQLTGDALVNKVALIIFEVIVWALILGYISDYLTGTAPFLYFVAFEAVALTSSLTVAIVYRANPKALRHVALICFSAVYAVGCLGAHIDLAFVMGFPILAVFILYYDRQLIGRMATIFTVIIVVDIIYQVFFLKAHHSGLPINSSVLLMEFLGTEIFMIGINVVTNITIRNNTEKLDTIQSVNDRVNESIRSINGEITVLNESSEAVKLAMEEINTGITNTAEAVQDQLLQTEEIQERIENVEIAAGKISENVSTTMEAVFQGNEGVAQLVQQADSSVAISEQVVIDLNHLKDSISAMSGITQLIENIAFQTNIMALNANVEAAHAGEAGRGFAVVASEISNMSARTKDATSSITELIENSTKSLEDLVTSITEMASVIRSEKEQTELTSAIFTSIQSNTEEVNETVALFMDYIAGLTQANRQIVQSVSTISATTEEVTALTAEALAKEHGNADSLDSIASQMHTLAQE